MEGKPEVAAISFSLCHAPHRSKPYAPFALFGPTRGAARRDGTYLRLAASRAMHWTVTTQEGHWGPMPDGVDDLTVSDSRPPADAGWQTPRSLFHR